MGHSKCRNLVCAVCYKKVFRSLFALENQSFQEFFIDNYTVHQIYISLMEYVRVTTLSFHGSARILALHYQLLTIMIQKEKQI